MAWPRQRSFTLVIAGLTLFADQLSKYFLLHNLAPGQIKPLLPALLNLRLVWNDGAAFSLFPRGAVWLAWISLLVSAALLIWIWRAAAAWRRLQQCAAGFLLGGSMANGLDRWRFGAVIDGLEFVPVSFPVFNLADVAINLAVLCLLIDLLSKRR